MAKWRHSLKQMFHQGSSADEAGTSSLSPPASSSSKAARRRSLLDLLGNSGNSGDSGGGDAVHSIASTDRCDPAVATNDEEGITVLSVQSREDDDCGEDRRGEKRKDDPPLFSMSSVDDDDDSDSDEEEEEDDDDHTLVLGQSTLTLSLDKAGDEDGGLTEDSVEARLAKLFEDDVEDVVETVLAMPDGPRKVLFIQEVLRHLRAIRTAATINSHFIVLSSLCTNLDSRGGAQGPPMPAAEGHVESAKL